MRRRAGAAPSRDASARDASARDAPARDAPALAAPALAAPALVALALVAPVRAGRADAPLAAGLAAAYAAFALTFRGPRRSFWQRMTTTGLVLGGLALAAEPELRRIRFGRAEVAAGLGSAAGLYGVFLVGDRLARRLLPKGAQEIGDIYALRHLRPGPELTARLGLVIGPAEELFWRGFVNERLGRHWGRWPGAALGAAAYGGAHVATGNFTLLGAAGVAGTYWSALAAAGMPMGALVVSHVAWDLWTFLAAPTSEASDQQRS
ncbi:MAG TPA: CPBP family glutamic-type intramembrane protease [Actinomycetes bacterium]|nr:CPBP family glutamic-type intramembrane protease [Actinomycetes bacterium]